MKKTIIILGILTLFASQLVAQEAFLDVLLHIDNPELLAKVGLSEAEIQKVVTIIQETKQLTKETQLELNILRAELEKELYYTTADLKKIESILKQSHELRMKVEMAKIKAYVDIKAIIGPDRLKELERIAKNFLESKKRGER